MSARPVVLFSLVALVASTPALAQAPVVRSGECVYLYGAPPGEPAAPTESFAHGTRVYDVCSEAADVQVGRDAPHRLTAGVVQVPAPPPRGCVVAAWSQHEFVVEAAGPVVVVVTAAGDVAAAIWATETTNDNSDVELTLRLELMRLADDGTALLLDDVEVVRRRAVTNRLDLDDEWARRLKADASPGERLAIRLLLELKAGTSIELADVGSAGSGRGAAYRSLDVCVLPAGPGSASASEELERDLYERRCMPSIWLPRSLGGRLESAQELVETLLERATVSRESGANLSLARQRLDRASEEASREQYQRACRSLADAVRALTTP